MTALRERMIEDLQLHGPSNNTQLCFVRSVQFLAEYLLPRKFWIV
jgi:hypothetical protein